MEPQTLQQCSVSVLYLSGPVCSTPVTIARSRTHTHIHTQWVIKNDISGSQSPQCYLRGAEVFGWVGVTKREKLRAD